MIWELILRLLLAGVLGAVIGLDREYRAKEAGFRTHFLVSLGSALFMIISQYGFAEIIHNDPTIKLDPSQKQFVRGLTTAAGLWATAGIGMAIGGGMYGLGVAATLLTLAGLELLTLLFKNVGLRTMIVRFVTHRQENLTAVLNELEQRHYRIISYKATEEHRGEQIVYRVALTVKIREQKEEHALFSYIQSLPDLTLTEME